MPVAVLIAIMIAIVVGVALISPVKEAANQITEPQTTSTIANGILNQPVSPTSQMGIPQDFGSPTWVLVIGLILLCGVIAAWIIGHKRKFAILGDEEE